MAKTEETLRIRPMEPGDLDAILQIDRKISGSRRAITYGINEVIGGQFDLSFVSESGDEIIGFIMASVRYVPESVTEACVIQILGVDPDYWRRGIASTLIKELLNTARSKEIKMVRIMVDQQDKQLHSLFEYMGFQRGRLIDYSMEV